MQGRELLQGRGFKAQCPCKLDELNHVDSSLTSFAFRKRRFGCSPAGAAKSTSEIPDRSLAGLMTVSSSR